MALKVTLKPQERVIIGGAVVTNSNGRTELVIENDVPILREKDIMKDHDATTPCRRIYFVIQLMYIDDKNLVEHHGTYWKLIQDVLKAAPSMLGLIDQMSDHILGGRYYKALKIARKLIDYEQEVTENVRNPGRSSI